MEPKQAYPLGIVRFCKMKDNFWRLVARREVQGYERVWSSTLRGLLQTKVYGTGHGISLTFPTLPLKITSAVAPSAREGRAQQIGEESRTQLGMRYLIPVHKANILPLLTIIRSR